MQNNKSSFLNLIANIIKIAGKSIWQFALPALLSTVSFAQYGSIQYFSATLVPLSNLGSQHVIMRSGTSTVPFLAMLLHSLVLVLVEALIISIVFNFTFLSTLLLFTFGFSTILYNNLAARIKSLKLFKYSLFVECAAALAYVIGLVFILKYPHYFTQIVIIEIIVFLFAVLIALVILIKVKDDSLMSFRGFKNYYKAIYNIGINVVMDTLVWRLVPIYFIHLLPDFKEQESVFYFSLLLGNAFVLVPSSIIESWIPEIANEYIVKRELFRSFFKKKLKIFNLFFFSFLGISTLILVLVLNTVYIKFYNWRFIIMSFVALRIISSCFDLHSATLYATKNERKLISPSIISAIVLCLSSTILFSQFQFLGILAAYIISRMLLSYMTYRKFTTTFSSLWMN